ncbi:MAG: FAD-dependent oxidoreductase [Chloroflexi bacterium]|nr:FAD-dependent oxidoreductase [Chloroflexota bacterium]
MQQSTAPVVQPPCQNECPIHQDARGYLAAIARGEFDRALEVVRETNPLPIICATICSHPCENKCRRGKVDLPLSIRALKRVAVEQGKSPPPAKPKAQRSQKVAVIGSGPAGLTAAHDLAHLGYSVTILERDAAPGGAMTNFVPIYRLPREWIKRDIDAITALGVTIKTNHELGKNVTIADLKKQGFNAILLAMGLPVSRTPGVPGENSEGVMLALPFLRSVNQEGYRLPPDKMVIVVGGGNVAIDVARSALRAGAAGVRMVCLEAPHEMPASPWEVEEAKEEGIDINCSWGPKQIIVRNGKLGVLECKKVKSVFDAQGRFNPSFYEEQCTLIEGDIIIMAIGQGSDLKMLPDMGVNLNERKQLVFDAKTMTTSQEGVFACGEVTTGPGSAVRAMSTGRRAALAIDGYLKGEKVVFTEPLPLGELAPEVVNGVKRIERNVVPAQDPALRVKNFNIADLGYDAVLGLKEARRCLNCGNGAHLIEEKCIACLTCVRVCPYNVPVTRNGKVDIRVDQCQACGICVAECPVNAIGFRMPGVEDIPQRIETAMKGSKQELGFYCSYDSYYLRGVNTQGMIGIPCLAKIDTKHLLKAFELGAERAFLAGCMDADCPFTGNLEWAQRRVDTVNSLLKDAGLGEGRVKMLKVEPDQFKNLTQLVAAAFQPKEAPKG